MKRNYFLIGVGALTAMVMASCSKSPAEVTNDVYSKANVKDFASIVEYIVPDSVTPFTDAEKAQFQEFIAHFYPEGENIYSTFTVECEEPAEDATQAKFTVNTQMTDGMSFVENGTLLKGNDGKWRLALVNAPGDTNTYFTVTNPDINTGELMQSLRYAYVMTMATRGLPEFQVEAARYFGDGIMVYKDKNKYFELIKNAADKGYPEALYLLADAYENGLGVNVDEESAFKYALQGAEAGNASAMKLVGYYYHFGEGTVRDYAKAAEWYKKALENGKISAANNLGYMYKEGEGVERDYKKAFELFKQGAEGGDDYAMNNLSELYENGDGTEKDMAKAIEWATKAAEAGYVNGMWHIADIYYEGADGQEPNYDKAFYWYNKAANEGNAYSMYMMGQCYEYGRGTDKDNRIALNWYRKAREKGYSKANAAVLRLL